MYRDFTYIDDLVHSIYLLINKIPVNSNDIDNLSKDNVSPVAPYRVVNIGNSTKIKLLDFIEIVEDVIGKKAIRNYMPMQKGDVMSTWADTSVLQNLTGYHPKTNVKDGVKNFVNWYRKYYNN